MEGFTTSAMQVFSQLVLTVGALGGALLLVVYLLQDKILYVPNVENLRHHYLKPEQFGLYAWEDLYLKTPDGETIQIWFFKLVNGSSTAPTFLYFHGNAGNISHRLPHIRDLLRQAEVNVCIVSYRGYGKSTGHPIESGLKVRFAKIDAQVALDYLYKERTDIDRHKIFVFGSSLGGAVSIDLAHNNQDKLAGLVVENTFTCVGDMVDSVLPPFKYFKFLVTNPWSSIDKIPSIKIPVLFLSGKKDELVPEWMMIKLHAACGSTTKQFVSFPTGQHVDTWTCDNYYIYVKSFVDLHSSLIDEKRQR